LTVRGGDGHHRRVGRPWLVTSFVIAVAASAPAMAQQPATPPPVILIVESANPAVGAEPIRAALAARTGRRVLSLSSAEAHRARAIVSISVLANGEAHLLAVLREGSQALAASTRGDGEDDPTARLSTAAATLLASLDRGGDNAVGPLGLLPWGAVEGRGAGATVAAAVGLLPWPEGGAAATRHRVTHPEGADGLSAPTPSRAGL
jgi:hypothetical protein